MTRSVWMRLTVDGQVTDARLFSAGETHHISAVRDASIRAGDGGAVLVSVNAGQKSALGPDGQAITRRFGAHERDRVIQPPPSSPILASAPPRASETAPAAVPPSPEAAPDSAAAETLQPAADSVQGELVASTEQWLDAYYAQDRVRMAAVSSPDIRVADERPVNQRLPRGLAGVRRTLATVRVEVTGSTAVLTATMTELATDPAAEFVSLISETWSRRDGEWRLNEIRIVSAESAQTEPIFVPHPNRQLPPEPLLSSQPTS